ncbi:MAG: HupE/UreJ family protein, partial [Solirubrobacterales bacterium]
IAVAAAGSLLVAGLVTAPALAHSGAGIEATGDLSGWAAAGEFMRYGTKHIVLGFDHLLFLCGLALLTKGLRDLAAIAGIFALAYSATLVGGTLLGIAVPGELIDAVIALSVGFVGAQIAFGGTRQWLGRDPRAPAFAFGLAHGLGLSSLLQELRLPGDELLPSVLGFNVGVELGQIAVILAFVAILAALRAFPFPERERIPAGCALISVSAALLAFLGLGVSL